MTDHKVRSQVGSAPLADSKGLLGVPSLVFCIHPVLTEADAGLTQVQADRELLRTVHFLPEAQLVVATGSMNSIPRICENVRLHSNPFTIVSSKDGCHQCATWCLFLFLPAATLGSKAKVQRETRAPHLYSEDSYQYRTVYNSEGGKNM